MPFKEVEIVSPAIFGIQNGSSRLWKGELWVFVIFIVSLASSLKAPICVCLKLRRNLKFKPIINNFLKAMPHLCDVKLILQQ